MFVAYAKNGYSTGDQFFKKSWIFQTNAVKSKNVLKKP